MHLVFIYYEMFSLADDMESYLLDDDDEEEEEEIIRDDLINPYWIEDKELKNGKEGKISTDESLFWKDMIDKVSCFGQHL